MKIKVKHCRLPLLEAETIIASNRSPMKTVIYSGFEVSGSFMSRSS
jgi:hypothetical protein